MVLTSKEFGSAEEVTEFIKENKIIQGHIQSITSTGYFGGFVMFYWGVEVEVYNVNV